MDVFTGECVPLQTYRVEGDTDLLTVAELAEFEADVIAADRAEIKSFLDHKIFKTGYIEFAEIRPMTCVWVRKWKRKVLPSGKISYIIKSIVVGVDYLHRQGFVHRSISSSSVFVAGDSTMQLGHFKHAISTADESTGRRKAALYSRHEEEAQIPWQAPEYFRQDTVGYTEKIDIYSIGVVALELAYGAHPFEGMLPTATMLLKLQDETGALGLIAPGCKRRPSKALWQLLTQCLREDDFNRRVGINKPQHHSTTAPQH